MLVNGKTYYLNTPFNDEPEIEQVVKDYSENLFGKNAIYLPKAKISTMGGTGTIPDGFVINIGTLEWYIVEAELAAHGTWEHIAPQITKQLVAVETHKSRERILNLAVDFINANKEVQQIFADLDIEDMYIHRTVADILKKPPIVSIPIDSIPPDLEAWAKTQNSKIKIWVIEKFTSPDQKQTFYSIPDENTPSLETSTSRNISKVIVAARWSQPFQDVLAAKFIEEGQTLVLDYGPRGKSKKRFTSIVRKEGVEMDGMILSLSSSAIMCIKKAGGTNDYADGWWMWKTEDGRYLGQVYAEPVNRNETNKIMS